MKAAIQKYFHSLACSEVMVFNSSCNLLDLTADDPCFLFDLQSRRIHYVCSTISSMLGYRDIDFLNKGLVYLKQLIHPEDFSSFISDVTVYSNSVISNNFEQKGFKHSVVRIKHKKGYWVDACIVFSCLNRLHGRIQEIIIGKLCRTCFEDEMVSYEPGTRISNREREVLQLLGIGDSSKIIAHKLHIGETTVITHRKNLIQKFKARNTAELIKEATKSGIIE